MKRNDSKEIPLGDNTGEKKEQSRESNYTRKKVSIWKRTDMTNREARALSCLRRGGGGKKT